MLRLFLSLFFLSFSAGSMRERRVVKNLAILKVWCKNIVKKGYYRCVSRIYEP